MMLVVNGIIRGIQCPDIVFWVNDYESAFELLTQLVADQWTLRQATLIDGMERMPLPTEAFDGQAFRAPVKSLEQQWKQILSTQSTPSTALGKYRLKDWHCRLDVYYGQQLTQLQTTGLALREKLTRLVALQNPSLRLRLWDQYNRLLESNQRMLSQTVVNRQRNQDRLAKLEKS